jgi:hypothetical protein
MPRTRSHSRVRTTLYATLALAVCVVPPFLMSSSSGGCQLDTSPRISKHPPVESADDADSGDDDK